MAKKTSERVSVYLGERVVGSLYLRWQIWWFDLRMAGVRHKLNMRTEDLEEAIGRARLEASKVQAELPPPAAPAGPAGQALFTPAAKVRTLADALTRYEEWYTRTNRASSARRTLPVVREFVAFVGAGHSPQVVARQHLVAFRDGRAARCSRHTANGDLIRVKGFTNFLRAEGLLYGDPGFKIRRLKTSTIARESISPELVRAVLSVMEGNWLHDYVAVLAETGMRPQEALRVRGCDLDGPRRVLHIRAYGEGKDRWELKDAEDRKIVLNESAYAVLARRKVQNGDDALALFAGRARYRDRNEDGTPAGRKSVAKGYMNAYHAYKKRIEDALEDPDRKGALPKEIAKTSPYDYRHFFATRCVAEGWPPERLMRYLGHANLSTTMRYYVDQRAIETGAPPVLVQGRERTFVSGR